MLDDTENANTLTPKPAKFLGARHGQYTLLVIAIVLGFGMRSVLNVAVIAMLSNDPPNENIPTYPEWSSKKNIMLSSFFWGYICFQVGAGQIAKNYGPKLFLGGAMFISSVSVLLLPYLGAQFGYIGVIVSRIAQGMTQGFLFPSNHNLLSSWTPVSERAKIGGLVYAGAPLGTVVALPLTGVISASSVGWPVAFYLYGVLGIVWSLVWMWFGADSPSTHKSISVEERKYIEAGLPTEDKDTVPTPWKSIFTSLPFWSIIIAHCGQNWGYWTLLTEIPSYMEEILGFEIDSNSYLSALPYFIQWLISFILSPAADLLIIRNVLSTGASRKIFNSIGLFVPAIALFSLNFVGSTQKALTIIILVVAVGFNAGVYNGFQVNHIDISPIHAGTLMAITNSSATFFSILAPLAVDALKAVSGYEETVKSLWNIVFSLAAGVYVVAGVFYICAASGEVQPWDNLQAGKKTEPENDRQPSYNRYQKKISREMYFVE